MKKPVQFGKYLLLDRINVGGMAEVFKAKAFGVEGFERLVAVKRILPNIAEDEEFITMFIDEAKIAVQLSHANIAQIFDLGKVDDAFFIALEFVSGKDLRAIFDRCKAKPTNPQDSSPAMALAQACFIIMKACEGLDYAHNKRDQSGQELHLVHRDVSPQNILISFEGEVKLIDFGIAKAAGKASKTQQGILKGKFGYMSPEQVRGLPLDRRSDIFSVGICLYEMLTAERLFVGESDFSTLEKVRNVEILPPSTYNRRIPEELERICLKALAKDVEDRYQNAIDLHDDLQAFMYTAGEFYSRKDLGLWMKRIYDEEIKGEQSRVESYSKIPAIAPPPPPTPSAPPADRPIRRTATGIPAISMPPPPPAAATAGAGVPRITGQHAAVAQAAVPNAEISNLVTTPDSAPVAPAAGEAPRNGKHQNGHANGKHKNGAHAADLNWDDEELATNIYDDKPEDAGDSVVSDNPARPDLSSVELAADGAPVPARATPSRGVPEHHPLPTKLTYALPTASPISHTDMRPRPRKSGPGTGPLVAAGVTIVLVLGAAVGGYNYLATRPGQIQLTSEPAGAVQILIDNQRVPVEGTPATILRPPGSYSLTVQREGYVPYSEQIELHSREVLKKHVPLEPLTSGTGFRLTEPIGAQVFLDGKQLDGQTPLQVQSVMPGKHKVEVRGQYGTWSEDVTLEAGKVADLHPVFPATQPTNPTPPPPVHVSDAPLEPVRHTPAPRDDVRDVVAAPPRPRPPRDVDPEPATPRPARTPVAHKAVSNDSDSDLATPSRTPEKVEKAERTPAPQAAPSSGEGYLRIGSKPWANIIIDGKDTGLHTPQTHIKLSAGSHRIQLTNPQFNIKDSFSIDIGAGETRTETRDLRPKDQQDDND